MYYAYLSSLLYTFKATKQIHTCASILLSVKWNIGWTSSVPFVMRKTLCESSHNGFKTLKSDLDMRPVFQKTDDVTKAHLNLAFLAYWVVSTTKYRLKQKGIKVRCDELLRIMSTLLLDKICVVPGTTSRKRPSLKIRHLARY